MRFIGLCIYIRRHIPHLQLHLKPLQATVNAFNKTGDFLWGPPQELAFNNLKSIVSENLRLSYVPSCKEMGLYCDGSGFGGHQCRFSQILEFGEFTDQPWAR